MMKAALLSFLLLFYNGFVKAQTLFTYGHTAVSKEEFITAFNKNLTADTTSRKEALRNYLTLYINYKLKVKAAHDEKLDITDEYRNDKQKFKLEAAETAINNEANINSLVEEAMARSKKDVELSQLFIPVAAESDTSIAFARINEAYSQLEKGTPFAVIASRLGQDSSLQNKEGNIGFITVFTLPYNAENLVYNLNVGSYTKPYHSRIGYHIFKKISERPALGNRTIQQLLFPVSSKPSETEKSNVKREADSVYGLVQQGASFADLQLLFGSAKSSRATQTISVGEYTPSFENEVFAVKNEGDESKPFFTAYGWNIVKLIRIEQAIKDTGDVTAKAMMQEKVMADDRLSVAKKNLEAKWMTQAGYKPVKYDEIELWKFTDISLANEDALPQKKEIKSNTPLFSFANQKITAGDWVRFVQMKKQSSNQKMDYKSLMLQFRSYALMNYYKEHIDEFHPELVPQLDEFNDANLLFAAMDKHVWSQSATDTAGLLQYYEGHKKQYIWKPGADAIVVTANNKQVADELRKKISDEPAFWHTLVNSYGSLAQADSTRFEYEQLPAIKKANLQAGYATEPVAESNNDGYTFIYITGIHAQPQVRSFEEARGLVTNDYQQVEEEKWITALKKKYPVKVNEAVFQSIR